MFKNSRSWPSLSLWGSAASSHQISWRSVEQLLSYGDLTVLKMAAICHLMFLKIQNFNWVSMLCYAKFHGDRWQRCWDMAIFKMAAVRHLGFVVYVFRPPANSIWWYLPRFEMVGIDAVFLILCYLKSFGLKMPTDTPKWEFWVIWPH